MEGWRESRAQPGSWNPSISAILLHSLKLQGPGDRKAADGTFLGIPPPHFIYVLLLTHSPGFPRISSAPSLPVGAQATHPFPHRCSGVQQRLGQAVPNPTALPSGLFSFGQGAAELGWERAAGLIQLQHWDGVARSFPATSSPPLGLHWSRGTLRPDLQPHSPPITREDEPGTRTQR